MYDRIKNALERMSKMRNELEGDFPVSALPKAIQNIVEETAERLSFSPDFIASALIHAAGTAIGNTVNLDFRWKEAPNFYMAFIAGPGTGKTHPISWAYAPIRKRDDLEYEKFLALELEEFKQTILGDTTVEAMTVAVSRNKRGICVLADELAGVLSAGGRNKELYLTAWSREQLDVNRKTSKPLRIKNPFVSMIGTMQTNIVKDVMGKGRKTENGFLDRMILVRPKKMPEHKWGKTTKSGSAEIIWEEIINSLSDLKCDVNSNGEFSPHLITFSPDAENLAIEYKNNPIECTTVLSEDIVARINSKMDMNFLKLCIVIRCLKAATNDNDEDTFIGADTVKSAIELSNYYKKTAFEVWQDLTLRSPLDQLTELKADIYKDLFVKFKTATGVETAKKHGMCERTFKHWLSSDTNLFKQLGHGYYEKLYKR